MSNNTRGSVRQPDADFLWIILCQYHLGSGSACYASINCDIDRLYCQPESFPPVSYFCRGYILCLAVSWYLDHLVYKVRFYLMIIFLFALIFFFWQNYFESDDLFLIVVIQRSCLLFLSEIFVNPTHLWPKLSPSWFLPEHNSKHICFVKCWNFTS